jgi:hypothetical protein
MQGAVYIPPQPGLPDLAVVLSADGGSMMCAAPVPSFQEGEKYVASHRPNAAFQSRVFGFPLAQVLAKRG